MNLVVSDRLLNDADALRVPASDWHGAAALFLMITEHHTRTTRSYGWTPTSIELKS